MPYWIKNINAMENAYISTSNRDMTFIHSKINFGMIENVWRLYKNGLNNLCVIPKLTDGLFKKMRIAV